MKNKTYFLVTGVIFGLVSLLHLIRLVFWLPVQIGPWNVSFRISAIAFGLQASQEEVTCNI
jgi:hypothetical protein